MPHPTYGPPKHVLERCTLRLALPTPHNGRVASLTVHGETDTKRASLWTYSESWGPTEQERGLQVVDVARHVLLVALQDHPASQEALVTQLGLGGWVDAPLFT